MSCKAHDLVITPDGVTGSVPTGLDVALWTDIARALDACCKAWAEGVPWVALAGFDATGCFSLTPHAGNLLRFRRAAVSLGWHRNGEEDADSPDNVFPIARPPSSFDPLSGLASLQSRFTMDPSFAGFAVRSHKTGLWKPVMTRASSTGGTTALLACARQMTPIVKILAAQGLPWGRTLLRSRNRTAYLCRSPSKVQGCLVHTEPHSPSEAALAVDALLVRMAKENLQ